MRFRALVTLLAPQSLVEPAASDPEISGVATLEEATAQELAFWENKRFYPHLRSTQAGALILPEDPGAISLAQERQIPYVAVPFPRRLFAQAIHHFHPDRVPTPQIHPSAVIADSCHIGEAVYIGAHCVLGEGVVVGNHVQIYPNVTLYDEVTIGAGTIIHANCVIHPRSVIGQRCVLHSGVVIGDEGFGFVPTPEGPWSKMPQVGQVILEDEVEVGCNSAIDRAALGVTRIGKGTKIDNLVQIGHGCQVGAHALLAGQAGLAGGVKLGDHVVLAGQVGVTNHIQIGARSVIAAQSGISEDVPADSQQMGYPAFDAKQFFKATVLFRRLPEIYKIVKQLQARP